METGTHLPEDGGRQERKIQQEKQERSSQRRRYPFPLPLLRFLELSLLLWRAGGSCSVRWGGAQGLSVNSAAFRGETQTSSPEEQKARSSPRRGKVGFDKAQINQNVRRLRREHCESKQTTPSLAEWMDRWLDLASAWLRWRGGALIRPVRHRQRLGKIKKKRDRATTLRTKRSKTSNAS